MSNETLPPEPVDETVAADDANPEQTINEFITEPTKLMRIASMSRAMLVEVRDAVPDEAGRERLKEIYDRTIDELSSVLSEELREELTYMFVPLEAETPSAAELRIAQAQLVGWLEGLFNGIQAAVMTQQLAAQSQFQQIQQRRLNAPETGQYL